MTQTEFIAVLRQALPVEIQDYLDLHKITLTASGNTYNLITYYVPVSRQGVLRGYSMGVLLGSTSGLNFTLKVNGTEIPRTFNIGDRYILGTNINDIQEISWPLNAGDKIELIADNITAGGIDVFGRIKGWLWEKR